MKKLFAAAAALLLTGAAHANTEQQLYRADVDLGDRVSLQRGARTFVNYCVSCHSAGYARYSRLARDLEIPEEVVARDMMFPTDKIGNTMTVALRKQDAEGWFGVAPPDLSVVARSRGPDWLYTFLLTFYADSGRPTGVNNLAFKDTAMPHVLWELQGVQRPVIETEKDESGREMKRVTGFELTTTGRLSGQEYRSTVRDLVNFLVYLGEPAKLVRYEIGAWVIVFLIGFFFVAYALKKEYWKDVH